VGEIVEVDLLKALREKSNLESQTLERSEVGLKFTQD